MLVRFVGKALTSSQLNQLINSTLLPIIYIGGQVIDELVKLIVENGFDIQYKKTRLADAYVDFEKKRIIVKKRDVISLLHECIHVLYEEIFEELLPERAVEESAKKLIKFAHP